MLESHRKAAPHSQYIGREKICLTTLDAYAGKQGLLDRYRKIFLKVDTQGYEMEVLAGSQKILAVARMALAEMTIASLYENGSTFAAVYQALEESGLSCIYLSRGFFDEKHKVMLQADGLFLRR
jgi:hypothetical protein